MKRAPAVRASAGLNLPRGTCRTSIGPCPGCGSPVFAPVDWVAGWCQVCGVALERDEEGRAEFDAAVGRPMCQACGVGLVDPVEPAGSFKCRNCGAVFADWRKGGA